VIEVFQFTSEITRLQTIKPCTCTARLCLILSMGGEVPYLKRIPSLIGVVFYLLIVSKLYTETTRTGEDWVQGNTNRGLQVMTALAVNLVTTTTRSVIRITRCWTKSSAPVSYLPSSIIDTLDACPGLDNIHGKLVKLVKGLNRCSPLRTLLAAQGHAHSHEIVFEVLYCLLITYYIQVISRQCQANEGHDLWTL